MTRNYLDPPWVPVETATTKGDLWVADGAGHATRLAAGSDGTALVADSTQTAGVKWQQRSRCASDVHTDTSPAAVNTAAKTALATLAIPTTIAAGDALRLIAVGDLLNNSGGAINYTWAVDLGATSQFSLGAFSLSASAARRNWRLEVDVLVAAASDERSSGQLLVSGAAGTSVSAHGFGEGTAALDLTVATNLIVSITMGSAALTIDCVCHHAMLEIFKR